MFREDRVHEKLRGESDSLELLLKICVFPKSWNVVVQVEERKKKVSNTPA